MKLQSYHLSLRSSLVCEVHFQSEQFDPLDELLPETVHDILMVCLEQEIGMFALRRYRLHRQLQGYRYTIIAHRYIGMLVFRRRVH